MPSSCISARFEGKFFRFPAKMTVLEGYRQICAIIDYGGDVLEILVAKIKHIENREYFNRFENTFRHSAARRGAKKYAVKRVFTQFGAKSHQTAKTTTPACG